MSRYLIIERPYITRLLDTAGIVALVGAAVSLVALELPQVLEREAAVWAAFAINFRAALALILVSRVIEMFFYTRDAEALIRRSKADRADSRACDVAPIKPAPVWISRAADKHEFSSEAAVDDQRTAA